MSESKNKSSGPDVGVESRPSSHRIDMDEKLGDGNSRYYRTGEMDIGSGLNKVLDMKGGVNERS